MEDTPMGGFVDGGSPLEEKPLQNEDLLFRSLKVDLLTPRSSLQVAMNAFLRTSSDVLPVVEGSSVVGALWRESLERAVLDGVDKNAPVEFLMDRSPIMFSGRGSVRDAWEVLKSANRTAGIVLDEEGGCVGVVTIFSLSPESISFRRLPVIGGLATPFGVYLSAGQVSAGAGRLSMFLTGVVLSILYVLAFGAGYGLVTLAGIGLGITPREGLWREMWIVGFGFVFFLVFLRMSPLSGIHGAEHMVVHALERGETLAPERVRQMPKEHPRCGTNIMAGVVIFVVLVLFLSKYLGEFAGLLAMTVGILFWRRAGWVLQRWFTTKVPSFSQLENGIAVGKELLDKLRQTGYREVGFWEKLANSGIPWVMLGALVAGGLLWVIMKWMGWGFRLV